MNSNTIKKLVPASNESLVDKQTTSRWDTAKLIKSSLTPLFSLSRFQQRPQKFLVSLIRQQRPREFMKLIKNQALM